MLYKSLNGSGFKSSSLSTIGSGKETQIDQSTIKICLGYAYITYKRFNDEYKVYLPYSRKNCVKMLSYKVILQKENGSKEIDITQQPGIPYLLSAADLEGDRIIISDKSTGKSHVYEGTEIPYYGVEVQ